MAMERRAKLPGREFLSQRLEASGLSRQESRRAVNVLVQALGDAISEGGFELRGFAVMTVVDGARRIKRNPRTGEPVRDEEGQPVYCTQRRVRVKVSKGA